ncbi:MAG: HEAT repeat domain-containing protein, partial [Deltaproteobacteria bacterium]|nr:HEAT repeat domain-containing protein [Deltaproteobacteria bacterium]
MRTLFAIHLNLLSTGLFLFIANIAGPVHAEYRSHDSHPPHFLASSLSSKANLGASKTLNRHVAAALESLMKGENHPRDEQVRNCQYVINHGPGWYCDKRLKLHSVFWEISHIIYKLPPETRGLFVEGCQSEAKLLLNKGLSEHRYDLIDDAIHRCPSSEPSHMAFVLMIQNLLDRKQPHLAALYARGLMAQPIEHNPQEIHLCARALASAGYKDEAIELWNKLPAKLNIAGESATKQRALELLHELLRAKHGPPVESIRTLAGAQNNEIFRRAIRLLSPKELATVLGVEDLEKTQSFSYCPLPVLVDSDVNYLTEDLFHQEFKPSAEQLMKAIVPASLIAKLGKALQSTEPHWLPSAAADALAKVGVPAIPTLIRALHTEETVPVTSLFAARALTKIGTPAVPALIHVLETGHQSAKRQAHAALFKIEGGSAILLLTAALKNPNVRWEAIDVLRATGKRAAPAVNELINVLETDDNVTIRTAAASALGSIEKGAVAAVNALAKMLLREEDGVARRTAAFALGKIQTSSALLALVKALEDRDMSVRLDVIVAIAEFGQKAALAVPMLTKVLNDENVRIRLAALSAI